MDLDLAAMLDPEVLVPVMEAMVQGLEVLVLGSAVMGVDLEPMMPS